MVFDYRGQLKTGDIVLHCWSSFPGENSQTLILSLPTVRLGRCVIGCVCELSLYGFVMPPFVWGKKCSFKRMLHAVCCRWTGRDVEPHWNHSNQSIHWERHRATHKLSRVLDATGCVSPFWQGIMPQDTHACSYCGITCFIYTLMSFKGVVHFNNGPHWLSIVICIPIMKN